MNARTFNNNPQKNTIPPWLLACTCEQQRCHCNARFKPDIQCVKGHPYNNDPPSNPSDDLTIQLIEFTYCNDIFPQETMENKTQKYQPLMNNITDLGWKVDPIIVITTRARGTTHSPSMKLLETTFEIPENNIKNTFKEINTIGIQHVGSIILHKRKIENNQPLPLEPIT